MTDNTKNQFDAPWYVFSSPDDEITVIENESGRVLAELDDVKTANRLSHLPELYDTLLHCICSSCNACIYDHCGSPVECEQLLSQDCTYELSKLCFEHKARELLRKVKDGV